MMMEFQPTAGYRTPTGSAARRTSSAAGPQVLPGAIKKVSSSKRASSLAVKILGKSAPTGLAPGSSIPVLKVTVTAKNLDARAAVSLENARPQGRGLSAVTAGSSASATYVGPPVLPQSGGAKGSVEVDGMPEPVPFCVGGQGGSWINASGRWKFTALHAPNWNWRENAEKPTEGQAVDFEIAGIDLKINVRPMTAMEMKRQLQLQALIESAEGEDYDSLRAQVTKARMASVEMDHIAKGEARLKELVEQGLHVNKGCDKGSISDFMAWSKVTSKVGAPDVNEPCTVCTDCPCNVDRNPGEVLEFVDEAVQECLDSFGPDSDKELFEGLVDAALAVQEGCVWKAGGKLIFSEFNRNQSVTALVRMLNKYGKQKIAEMIEKLVAHTEKKYAGHVTAIQVNFHPHKGTYHDQHRDIYSQRQSAGPNCTCQFVDCTGTVCYSLGSSRLVMLDTMTDELSSIKKCSEGCEGRKELKWLHSGNAMYFNGDWNNNHTHGIPPSEEECGPRISMAFLLAAKNPFEGVCKIR